MEHFIDSLMEQENEMLSYLIKFNFEIYEESNSYAAAFTD